MTLHVALIEPQIPPNTGNVMRLCAGADVPLHLIGPLGFPLDGDDVTRAALDHRDKVDCWEHPDWFAFRDAISRDRCIYFTSDARVDYLKAPFRKNSVLVFGNETDGMPARIVEKHRARCYRLPAAGEARSLNLANAVSVVLYEGLRQLGQDGTAPVFEAPDTEPQPTREAKREPRPDAHRGRRPEARPVAPRVEFEENEPNFNLAPQVPAVVPVIEEDEDEINYNVEQKPRVSAHPGRGPSGGVPRGGPKGRGPRGGPPVGGGAPKVGGRPRRGRGGRGKPPRP
jgi:tRNA (cytidine/uridine-2'-O-)-methyltransferase